MISNNTLIEALNWRYAVKKFDPTKKLNESQWECIEQALVLSPSSYGLQPWKFIVVQDAKLKAPLRKASWGQSQVEDCSHYIVFAAKETVTEADVDRYVKRMATVRGVPEEALNRMKEVIVGDVVTGARSHWVKAWTARQVYIALGQAMTAAALIGVDTCPMEGFDPENYDQILDLKGSGYYTVCALAVGFRHPEDHLSKAKKVRFETSELIDFR
jgi:nitroreductase